MKQSSAKRYMNVYLGLGSNMGDRAASLTEACTLISKNIGKIAKSSHIYETQPYGNENQDWFYNQVIMINTTMKPREVLEAIGRIEREMGRVRTEKWGPRPIDIDILLYANYVVADKGLEIPHPELHKRSFVLIPLMEIAPDLLHPRLEQPIDLLYANCQDLSEVIMLDGD
jgi:2-amino-4-hydroxy-6-hydroxymethyldihydropteridine diphosphokinase